MIQDDKKILKLLEEGYATLGMLAEIKMKIKILNSSMNDCCSPLMECLDANEAFERIDEDFTTYSNRLLEIDEELDLYYGNVPKLA